MLIDVKELRDAFLDLENDYRNHPDTFRAVVLGKAGEQDIRVAADRWTAYIIAKIAEPLHLSKPQR